MSWNNEIIKTIKQLNHVKRDLNGMLPHENKPLSCLCLLQYVRSIYWLSVHLERRRLKLPQSSQN